MLIWVKTKKKNNNKKKKKYTYYMQNELKKNEKYNSPL